MLFHLLLSHLLKYSLNHLPKYSLNRLSLGHLLNYPLNYLKSHDPDVMGFRFTKIPARRLFPPRKRFLSVATLLSLRILRLVAI